MTKRIVVGVDDTEGARTAIAWALREADLRGEPVEALHIWVEDAPFDEVAAKVMMTRVIDDARARTDSLIDPTLTVVVGESPRHVLVEASATADLLVIGGRGHGSVVDRMLGSVGSACMHHAHCPVVVVRV